MAEFYDQLTAESRMLVKTGRGEEHRWLKPAGKRNEKLDCTVYALFCAQMLGLHTLSDKLWARLEAGLEPDLFAGGGVPAPNAESDPAPVQTSEPPSAVAAAPPLPAPPTARPPAVRSTVPNTFIVSDSWSSRL
ncbi:hypothetical protein ASC88_16650 [Rhizobacter sp. Root29]|nr:hypothetical protein ASC88_16650 [Rhizobacter sp. Root29]